MIGTLLNERFRLERKLGSGGMSTVYRAYDETLERWVAIKVMHSEITTDAAQIERFRREARSVARLSHPHVVSVIDAGEDQGHPYIVLEYVEGETLKERIRRTGRLPVSEAVAYAMEVGLALSAAHRARLVHRDVKPQNVLVDPEGRAKITDFGIARSLEAEGLTQAGKVVGTTDYVSPEQALGQDVSGQSDIYSLGICLYEMLTGQPPFTGDSHVAVAMRHVQEPVPDVRERRPEVSAALALVIERATAKEPRNRYASVNDMVYDLEQALAIETSRSGEATGEATAMLQRLPRHARRLAPARLLRPHRFLIVAGVILVLVAAVAAALILVPGGERIINLPGLQPEELSKVALSDGDVADYDPPPGDGVESPGSLGNAIDGNPSTFWPTETYQYQFGSTGGKGGVGLVINTGTPIEGRQLQVKTSTPGWGGEVFAANGEPATVDGWGLPVATITSAEEVVELPLDTAGQEFSDYLLWINRLPEDVDSRVEIQELSLRY
jgi:eukaryotic-like serine/threonine-protein kinase